MGEFEVARGTQIGAPPERVHALLNDFREWRRWSPWEDKDPNLEREYSGPRSGPGARYAWKGNRKAGQGEMEILDAQPQRIEVQLTFEKPWKATNRVTFELLPSGLEATDVTWRMTGETTGFAALFSRVVPMDRMVGKDFEKGLARMKAAAEGGS